MEPGEQLDRALMHLAVAREMQMSGVCEEECLCQLRSRIQSEPQPSNELHAALLKLLQHAIDHSVRGGLDRFAESLRRLGQRLTPPWAPEER
jgi:hypothetical protein